MVPYQPAGMRIIARRERPHLGNPFERSLDCLGEKRVAGHYCDERECRLRCHAGLRGHAVRSISKIPDDSKADL